MYMRLTLIKWRNPFKKNRNGIVEFIGAIFSSVPYMEPTCLKVVYSLLQYIEIFVAFVISLMEGALFVCGFNHWNNEQRLSNSSKDSQGCITSPSQYNLDLAFKIDNVQCGSFHILLKLEDGTVLSIQREQNEVSNGLCLSPLEGIQAKTISAGCNISMVITPGKSCFAWGDPEKGKLGLGSAMCTGEQMNPRVIAVSDIANDFAAVACGESHCIGVSSKGSVWAWGSNEGGRCGTEIEKGFLSSFDTEEVSVKHVYSPLKVPALSSVVIESVTCGAYHSLALDRFGHVYGWGNNKYGQVGTSSPRANVPTPRLVKGFSGPVVRISGGTFHSLVVVQSGMVFSWGFNSHGQLGIAAEDTIVQRSPEIISALVDHRIVDVSAGGLHSIALAIDGSVYSFGHGLYGQLGHGDRFSLSRPKKVENIPSISRISCGRWFTGFVVGDPSDLIRYMATKPYSADPIGIEDDNPREWEGESVFLKSLYSLLPICRGEK